nr:MAG TPA: homing endonuclease [Caudoviricetes sp.]
MISWIYLNNDKTKYQISSEGFVISTMYNGVKGDTRKLRHNHDKDGYCIITLNHKDKKYTRKLHRLVAEAFIPNPDNYPEVNHKNGNKDDNNFSNLEWTTTTKNIHHAMNTNLRYRINSDEYIHEVCMLLEENKLSVPEISEKTGVSTSTIRKILYGQNWKSISSNYDLSKFNKKGYKTIKKVSNKMTDKTVIRICKLLERSVPATKIAKLAKVTPRMVYGIKYRESYTEITKKFNF